MKYGSHFLPNGEKAEKWRHYRRLWQEMDRFYSLSDPIPKSRCITWLRVDSAQVFLQHLRKMQKESQHIRAIVWVMPKYLNPQH
ncbi:unnamed protein product [Caretta caretta]